METAEGGPPKVESWKGMMIVSARFEPERCRLKVLRQAVEQRQYPLLVEFSMQRPGFHVPFGAILVCYEPVPVPYYQVVIDVSDNRLFGGRPFLSSGEHFPIGVREWVGKFSLYLSKSHFSELLGC